MKNAEEPEGEKRLRMKKELSDRYVSLEELPYIARSLIEREWEREDREKSYKQELDDFVLG